MSRSGRYGPLAAIASDKRHGGTGVLVDCRGLQRSRSKAFTFDDLGYRTMRLRPHPHASASAAEAATERLTMAVMTNVYVKPSAVRTKPNHLPARNR